MYNPAFISIKTVIFFLKEYNKLCATIVEMESGLCPDLYVQQGTKCYLVVMSSVEWDTAASECTSQNGRLAAPRDGKECKNVCSILESSGRGK